MIIPLVQKLILVQRQGVVNPDWDVLNWEMLLGFEICRGTEITTIEPSDFSLRIYSIPWNINVCIQVNSS